MEALLRLNRVIVVGKLGANMRVYYACWVETQYCFLVVLLRLAVPLCGFGLILYFRMKNILSDTILQMVDHVR